MCSSDLAVDLACDDQNVRQELLLWQPVHSGKQFMTQFLRIRMAASLIDGEAEKIGREACRERV